MKLLAVGFCLTLHALLAYSRARSAALEHGYELSQPPLDIQLQAWTGLLLALVYVLFQTQPFRPITDSQQHEPERAWTNCFTNYTHTRGRVLAPFLQQRLGKLGFA